MDVCGIFIGDTNLSYGTMRSSIYRDYEKYPYGTLENIPNSTIRDYYSKVQEKCHQSKKDKKNEKQECPFCKEQKNRPLIGYLRKRELQKDDEKICEEEEDIIIYQHSSKDHITLNRNDENDHHNHHNHNDDDDDNNGNDDTINKSQGN